MPDHPRSVHPGVCWAAKNGKWSGFVYDRSVRDNRGLSKSSYVGLFADEQACAEATAAKQAEIEEAIAQKLHAMAQELEHARDLPLRPKRAADAEPGTAYDGEKLLSAKRGPPRLLLARRWRRLRHAVDRAAHPQDRPSKGAA